MVENTPKKDNRVTLDPLLEKTRGYEALDTEKDFKKLPKSFPKISDKVRKVVALYMQLLWDNDTQGKIINVQDIINNCAYLFGSKYQSDNLYTARHIASDIREITCFMNFEKSLKTCFKNIPIKRNDIEERIMISSTLFYDYFSAIVHYKFQESYSAAKKVSEAWEKISGESLDIPNDFEEYLKEKFFDKILESFCIRYIYNLYFIFNEFLHESNPSD